jgi:hypothetical protein
MGNNVRVNSDLSEQTPAGTMQELTVASTPIAFAAFGDTVRYVWVSVATQSVSVTFDGVTDPDTSVGMALPANYSEVWSKTLAEAASFHQRGGAATVFGQPMA